MVHVTLYALDVLMIVKYYDNSKRAINIFIHTLNDNWSLSTNLLAL